MKIKLSSVFVAFCVWEGLLVGFLLVAYMLAQ